MAEQYLANAVKTAQGAVRDLDDILKPVGFEVILTHLINQAHGSAPPQQKNAENDTGDAEGWVSRIAKKLKCEESDISRVFFLDDDGSTLRLNLDTRILPKSAASASKDIAALLAAGRQAAKIDDSSTAFDIIRQECERYSRLNKSNFTIYLAKLKPDFIVKGSGRSQSLMVTEPGYEIAAETLGRYLGS